MNNIFLPSFFDTPFFWGDVFSYFFFFFFGTELCSVKVPLIQGEDGKRKREGGGRGRERKGRVKGANERTLSIAGCLSQHCQALDTWDMKSHEKLLLVVFVVVFSCIFFLGVSIA